MDIYRDKMCFIICNNILIRIVIEYIVIDHNIFK